MGDEQSIRFYSLCGGTFNVLYIVWWELNSQENLTHCVLVAKHSRRLYSLCGVSWTRKTILIHCIVELNPYKSEIFLYKPWRPKCFFHFKVIINVLVSSSPFIWRPTLWVYGHYKCLNSFGARAVFRRQNLTMNVYVIVLNRRKDKTVYTQK